MAYNFIIGVPYSKCTYKSKFPVCREDEALAVAFGAYLCGKTPLVFLQNAGLGHCLDFITSVLKPAGVEIPLVISNRKKPEHHAFMGKITKQLIKLLGYKKVSYEKQI